MSSFMPICQSFFKEKDVSYYAEGRNITFPCFRCQAMAIMDTNDTSWSCAGGHEGNLKSLIRLSEQGAHPEVQVYNPRQERARIRKMIKRLRSKYQDADKELSAALEELQKGIEQLIQYFSHEVK